MENSNATEIDSCSRNSFNCFVCVCIASYAIVLSLVLWCVMGAKRISNGGTTKMFWSYLKIRGLVITSDQDCMRYLPCHNLLIYYTGGGCGH